MRVLRSSLFVAATAIIAAACGDKVNIQQPTAKIESVVVSPPTASIAIGDQVTLTAAVNADPGITATVAWSSSSAAATVTQSGTVTGVTASPGVAICATASAANVSPVENCASVVVQAAAPIVPAVLQIASITIAGNLNSPVNVPPGFVAGQINVSVNLNPGTERMDSVIVMVNGKPAASQKFSDAQAAALRAASTDAAADQALQSTLVFSINTAAYVATTGAVTYPNGPAAFSVVGYGHQGGAVATNTSSQGVNLLFGNADAWVVTQTIGTTTVVNDPNGFAHTTGSVAVSAVPVNYSGLSIASATVDFGLAACDASGIGQRTLALTAPATGTFAWLATFADASQTTATNNATNRGSVNSYEFSQGLCGGSNATGGEGAYVASAQYTNTNSEATIATPPYGNIVPFANANPAPVVRLDNRAPVNAIPTLTIGGRTNNWVNDSLNLVGTSSTAGAAVIQLGNGAGLLQDNGVGLATVPVIATVTGGAITTGTSIANSITLAESATNVVYTAVYTFVDALGNTSSPGAAQKPQFGVDRTAPVLAIIVQPGNNKAFVADPALGFQFAATDNATPPAAPSGFFNLAATPLTVSETARNSLGTLWWCPSNAAYQKTIAAGGAACASWTTSGSQNFAANLITPDNGIGNNYFATTATVSDQAGNVSTVASNLFAVDAVTPVIGGISFPPFFTAGGPGTFTSAITTTGLDIALSRMNLGYAALAFTGGPAAPSTFWQPDVVVDAFNAATLQTSAPFTVTVNPVLTDIQVAGAAGANPAAVGAGVLTSVNAFAVNQPGTSSAVSNSAITGASLPVATGISNTGAAGAGPVNFLICATGNGAAAACTSPPAIPAAGTVTISRTGAASNPTSLSMTAVAEGLTGVFNNPFSAVQFWAYDPTAGATQGWRLITTVTNSSTVTDAALPVPSGRNWQFNTVWTPTLTSAPDNAIYTIVAIGIGGTSLPAAQQGMALGTPVGTVTVTVIP